MFLIFSFKHDNKRVFTKRKYFLTFTDLYKTSIKHLKKDVPSENNKLMIKLKTKVL